MISRFTRLFKKNDGDEQRALQRRVLSVLRELHPDKKFSKSDDPLIVNLADQKFGLTNVRANFLLSSGSESDLREIVAEHFENVFTGLGQLEKDELNWEQAKPILMPQLMPKEFLKDFPLVSFPIGEEVFLGFVIDSEKAYSYVSKADVEGWGVNELEIYSVSLDNLKERSNGIEADAYPGLDGFVVVNTMDGFDAVRIVLTELRESFSEIIGVPFYFGVPNRDFLICWAKNGNKDFQGRMRVQVSQDFDERPYPLSRFVFEALENGELKQVVDVAFDPRLVSAENN